LDEVETPRSSREATWAAIRYRRSLIWLLRLPQKPF
jgi:hypothetical protein